MNAFIAGSVESRLERMVGGARPVSVCHVEVNGLTALNATHGRSAGDALLRSVELALRLGTRRATDSVVALGGDELVVILMGATRLQALRVIRRVFARPLVPSAWQESTLGLSVGIVQFSRERTTADIVSLAETAMCAAKRAARTAATIGRDATSLRLALHVLPGAESGIELSMALKGERSCQAC